MKPAKNIPAFDFYDTFGYWALFLQCYTRDTREQWLPTEWPAPNYRSKLTPEVGILNPEFQYIPSTHTDVRLSWKRHGWRPKESAAPQAGEGPFSSCNAREHPEKLAVSAPRVIPIKERK